MAEAGKMNIQKDWGEVAFGFRGVRIFVFEQKLARNTLFLSKDIIVLDLEQVSCLVPAVLHLSAAKSERFDFNILKKLHM